MNTVSSTIEWNCIEHVKLGVSTNLFVTQRSKFIRYDDELCQCCLSPSYQHIGKGLSYVLSDAKIHRIMLLVLHEVLSSWGPSRMLLILTTVYPSGILELFHHYSRHKETKLCTVHGANNVLQHHRHHQLHQLKL